MCVPDWFPRFFEGCANTRTFGYETAVITQAISKVLLLFDTCFANLLLSNFVHWHVNALFRCLLLAKPCTLFQFRRCGFTWAVRKDRMRWSGTSGNWKDHSWKEQLLRLIPQTCMPGTACQTSIYTGNIMDPNSLLSATAHV